MDSYVLFVISIPTANLFLLLVSSNATPQTITCVTQQTQNRLSEEYINHSTPESMFEFQFHLQPCLLQNKQEPEDGFVGRGCVDYCAACQQNYSQKSS